jgi:phosphatidylserine/phosphatidylglycerophosphate/cardiolipin synthase-like enzyme
VLLSIILICYGALALLNSEKQQASITPINDRDYFGATKTAFEEAIDSIHIVLYGAKHYESPLDGNTQVNDLIAELGEAVARGVEVKVIFDQDWNNIAETTIHLKSLGIDVEFDSKDTRTHSKFIVIDGKILIIGSTNWSYHALQLNHEANVLIKSKELAKQYESYFDKIWSEH